MSLISVIIPFYKNSESILRALNSVFNQTLQNFEVLLINDASPDWNFAETLLKPIQDHRLQVLHHQVNKNGAAARNTGIKNAKGKYIAFLDADDEWSENHLEKSMICIEQKENRDLIFSKFLVKSDIEYMLPNRSFEQNEQICDYLFVKQQAIFTPSIFVKASVAKEILFDERLRRHQDYDFLLRFEAAGFRAKLSEHIGGTIHWEDNNLTVKGGTWQHSLKWVKDNRAYLTDKAYTNFIVQFIIVKLLKQKLYSIAVKMLLKECNLALVTKKNVVGAIYPVYDFLSMFLIGKRRFIILLHL